MGKVGGELPPCPPASYAYAIRSRTSGPGSIEPTRPPFRAKPTNGHYEAAVIDYPFGRNDRQSFLEPSPPQDSLFNPWQNPEFFIRSGFIECLSTTLNQLILAASLSRGSPLDASLGCLESTQPRPPFPD